MMPVADIFWLTLAGLVGLAAGSFANAAALRLARGEDPIFAPSRCRGCDRNLTPTENIPLFGYLYGRGRCRCGDMKLDARYPLSEFFVALAAIGLMATSGSVAFIWLAPALALVAIQALLDLETLTLDLRFSALLGLLGLSGAVSVGGADNLADAFAGGLVAGALVASVDVLYRLVRKRCAYGTGDVFFAAALGTFVGPFGALTMFVSANLLGAAVGIALIAAKKADTATKLPFGVYLAFGWFFAHFVPFMPFFR